MALMIPTIVIARVILAMAVHVCWIITKRVRPTANVAIPIVNVPTIPVHLVNAPILLAIAPTTQTAIILVTTT